jgi:hypothetical protein
VLLTGLRNFIGIFCGGGIGDESKFHLVGLRFVLQFACSLGVRNLTEFFLEKCLWRSDHVEGGCGNQI